MNAYNFCTEHVRTSSRGSLTFSTYHKRKFCVLYTEIDFDSLTIMQRKRLQNEMVDMYKASAAFTGEHLRNEPVRKIEIDLN